MKQAGYSGILIMTIRPTDVVHRNMFDESVFCPLWGESLTLPHPDDIENKKSFSLDEIAEHPPHLKENARVFTLRPGDQLRFADAMHFTGGVWHRHHVVQTPALSLQGHKIMSFLP